MKDESVVDITVSVPRWVVDQIHFRCDHHKKMTGSRINFKDMAGKTLTDHVNTYIFVGENSA